MEKSPDILYEHNIFSSFNFLPKYDEYDVDDEPNDQISVTEESELTLAERKFRFSSRNTMSNMAISAMKERRKAQQILISVKELYHFVSNLFSLLRKTIIQLISKYQQVLIWIIWRKLKPVFKIYCL